MRPFTMLWVFAGLGLSACGSETTSPEPAGGASVAKVTAADFSVIDLGTLGGTSSAAVAINNAGQIVGSSSLAGDAEQHAFLWQNGSMQDIGDLGVLRGINASAQVIGEGATGFLWENGVVTDLGTFGGISSAPHGINNLGQVVGWSMTSTGGFRSFIWENGVMRRIPGLEKVNARAVAINNAGQVVGRLVRKGVPAHAFLWENGVVTDLGTLGGRISQAMAINQEGKVVGYSRNASGVTHAFLWHNGVMTDLGGLGEDRTFASAISPTGQVVGYSSRIDGNGHAILWQNGALIDLGPGQAFGINRAGWIVGSVRTAGGSRAILWKPR